MAELSHDARTLGGRYTITIEHVNGHCFATMTARGRKTTWNGSGATPEAAKADVLRYLDSRLHPYVAVKIVEPKVEAKSVFDAPSKPGPCSGCDSRGECAEWCPGLRAEPAVKS